MKKLIASILLCVCLPGVASASSAQTTFSVKIKILSSCSTSIGDEGLLVRCSGGTDGNNGQVPMAIGVSNTYEDIMPSVLIGVDYKGGALANMISQEQLKAGGLLTVLF